MTQWHFRLNHLPQKSTQSYRRAVAPGAFHGAHRLTDRVSVRKGTDGNDAWGEVDTTEVWQHDITGTVRAVIA